MCQYINILKNLIKGKGFTQEGIANKIGMTRDNFVYALSKDALKVQTLVKIAKELEVDMSVFFGGEIEKKGDMKDTYITDLRKLVEKLEVENSELRKKIGVYEGKKI